MRSKEEKKRRGRQKRTGRGNYHVAHRKRHQEKKVLIASTCLRLTGHELLGHLTVNAETGV